MSSQQISAVLSKASGIILGKQTAIKLALCTLLSRGHLLIEDLPGVGKTTLAHLIGKLIGLDFHRIQFTSDLLPADILGVSIYERNSESFNFHQGPVFCQLLLADEVNRATPKTQSALLEAMEEKQVTIDGVTHILPQPFFVIATQNPASQIGTFPLPESQLDRFLMRIEIGYPDAASELALLEGEDRRDLLDNVSPVITPNQLIALQKQTNAIHVAQPILHYCQDLLSYSRQAGIFVHGLSPRAGLALIGAAKSWAMMEGREEVLPEDLQAVVPAVVNHRLIPLEKLSSLNPGKHLLEHVAVP